MDVIEDWGLIRKHFNKSFRNNFYIPIASVDARSNPNVTPIGTLFLNDNQTGFYFEKFPKKLRENAEVNRRVSLLSVNSNRIFWLTSLIRGVFKRPLGIQLYGKLGGLRKATPVELYRLERRMLYTKWTKGHKYLWDDMQYVRDIDFNSAQSINLGKMTH